MARGKKNVGAQETAKAEIDNVIKAEVAETATNAETDEKAANENAQANADDISDTQASPENSPSEQAPTDTQSTAQATLANSQAQAENSTQATLAPSQSSAPIQTKIVQQDPRGILEAALFMASQPLASQDLAKLVGIAAIGYVDEMLGKISADYGERKSAIEVVREENGKWSMRVRANYAPSVRNFAGEAEISRHALRTLAYISRNDGIKKRDLFNKLGSTIYEDVAELLDKGFVTATPSGRTVSLKTTAKFKQYFEG